MIQSKHKRAIINGKQIKKKLNQIGSQIKRANRHGQEKAGAKIDGLEHKE
jgi:hypothetical protein